MFSHSLDENIFQSEREVIHNGIQRNLKTFALQNSSMFFAFN